MCSLQTRAALIYVEVNQSRVPELFDFETQSRDFLHFLPFCIFFIFFIFFFNWLSKNIYVTLERSNFSRFNTKKLRQLLLFFQRRRFRLLVFFNGKRKRERERERVRAFVGARRLF